MQCTRTITLIPLFYELLPFSNSYLKNVYFESLTVKASNLKLQTQHTLFRSAVHKNHNSATLISCTYCHHFVSNFPLILFTLNTFLSYVEHFRFWNMFQTVKESHFLNSTSTVPVIRPCGGSFTIFRWQSPPGLYAWLCKALVDVGLSLEANEA